MLFERPTRRQTLRQQLTHAEKCSRDLIEHFQGTLLPIITDIRDLSRPIRRRSHFPKMVALANALNKLQECGTDSIEGIEYLQEHLHEIREHARRERVNRR